MQERRVLALQLESQMPFGALVGNSTSGIQTGYFGGFSDEQVYALKSEY